MIYLSDNDERKGLPSGSAWRRFELCSGSYQLGLEAERLGQVAHKSSAEAQSGERRHAAMVPGANVVLEGVEETDVAFMRERSNDQIARIFGEEPIRELWEKRFWLTIGGKERASCRIDRLVVSKDTGLIQDFKFGFREPDAAEINAQLKFAVVTAALNFRHINNWIVQIVSGPYGVTEAHYDIKAIAHAYDEVVETLRRITDSHAGFSPSVEACRYCSAVMICQATKDLVLPVAKLQHSALPEGDRAAKLLDECELLERHIEQIRAYYKERLETESDYSVPGYGLAPGPQRRAVEDWKRARARLEEFIPAAELEALANYSIPSVEKLIGKALKLRAKESSAKLGEILGELLSVKPGNLCLKRMKGEPKASLAYRTIE